MMNFLNKTPRDIGGLDGNAGDYMMNSNAWPDDYFTNGGRGLDSNFSQSHLDDLARLDAFDMLDSPIITDANLYIKNIDYDISDDALYNVFSQLGEITSHHIVRDANKRSRGFGFMSYRSADQAKRAIVELNGRFIGKKPIVVMLHIKKEQRRLQKQLMHETIGPTIPHSHGYNSHHGPVGPMTGPLREQMYLQQQVLLGLSNGNGNGNGGGGGTRGGIGPVGPMGYGYPNQRGNPTLMRDRGGGGGGGGGRGMDGRQSAGGGGYYESGYDRSPSAMQQQHQLQLHQQQQQLQQQQQHLVMDENGDILEYDHQHQMRKQQLQHREQEIGLAQHREELMAREEMRMLQRLQDQQKRLDGSQGVALGQGQGQGQGQGLPVIAPSLTSLMGGAASSGSGVGLNGRYAPEGDGDAGFEAAMRMLSLQKKMSGPQGSGSGNGQGHGQGHGHANSNSHGSGNGSGGGSEFDVSLAMAAGVSSHDWLNHGPDIANSLLSGLSDDGSGLTGFLGGSNGSGGSASVLTKSLAVASANGNGSGLAPGRRSSSPSSVAGGGTAPRKDSIGSAAGVAVGTGAGTGAGAATGSLLQIMSAEPSQRRQLLLDSLQPLIAQHKPFLARSLAEFLVDNASASELCDCLDNPALLVPHYINVALGMMKMPVFTDPPAAAPSPVSVTATPPACDVPGGTDYAESSGSESASS